MAQFSGFWPTTATPTGDQVADYTDNHHADMVRILAGASSPVGVLPVSQLYNTLASTGAGANTVQVDSGEAVVDGAWYHNTTPVNVNIPSAVGAGNTRIDRIVLRRTGPGFDVAITRLAGVDAASPSAPALTQVSGTTWDLPLAQVLVNTSGTVVVTDERVWASGGIVDNATLEKAASILRVKDLGISAAKLAADAVTTTKIQDGAVSLAKLANDSVDDTKVGNRVPALIRRQGGSSTDWSIPGTTTYTPGAVREQTGTAYISDHTAITFPVAFSQKPTVVLTAMDNFFRNAQLHSVSTTGFVASVFSDTGAIVGTPTIVFWTAKGSE